MSMAVLNANYLLAQLKGRLRAALRPPPPCTSSCSPHAASSASAASPRSDVAFRLRVHRRRSISRSWCPRHDDRPSRDRERRSASTSSSMRTMRSHRELLREAPVTRPVRRLDGVKAAKGTRSCATTLRAGRWRARRSRAETARAGGRPAASPPPAARGGLAGVGQVADLDRGDLDEVRRERPGSSGALEVRASGAGVLVDDDRREVRANAPERTRSTGSGRSSFPQQAGKLRCRRPWLRARSSSRTLPACGGGRGWQESSTRRNCDGAVQEPSESIAWPSGPAGPAAPAAPAAAADRRPGGNLPQP